MAGIMDLINSDLGKQIIGSITQQTGISEQQAGSVVANGLPEILGKLQQNNDSDGGGLLGALLGGKHDGSILDNVGGYLNGGNFDDGGKILGHVFGNDTASVENSLSEKTGVSSSIISKILPMLMPIIMGYLGKQVSNGGVSDSGGLGSILGSVLGGGNQQGGSSMGGNILTSMLDQDGDGQLGLGDAITAITKNSDSSSQSSGGLGGLLGKLFGKK
jgi:hypothetical protein